MKRLRSWGEDGRDPGAPYSCRVSVGAREARERRPPFPLRACSGALQTSSLYVPSERSVPARACPSMCAMRHAAYGEAPGLARLAGTLGGGGASSRRARHGEGRGFVWHRPGHTSHTVFEQVISPRKSHRIGSRTPFESCCATRTALERLLVSVSVRLFFISFSPICTRQEVRTRVMKILPRLGLRPFSFSPPRQLSEHDRRDSLFFTASLILQCNLPQAYCSTEPIITSQRLTSPPRRGHCVGLYRSGPDGDGVFEGRRLTRQAWEIEAEFHFSTSFLGVGDRGALTK